MRTLILSDIHIGDPRYINTKTIQILLVTEKYDQLILNGDFLDLWLADIEDVFKDPLLSLIENISHVKKVIWIIGNHDQDILNFGKSIILHKSDKVEFVEINSGDKKILIIHGHQVYRNKNYSGFNKLLSKVDILFYKFFEVDFQYLYTCTYFYKKYVQRKRQKMLKKYGHNADYIIMGHTHLIGYIWNGKTELFDIGSSMKTKSYAIVEDGLVWLKLIN